MGRKICLNHGNHGRGGSGGKYEEGYCSTRDVFKDGWFDGIQRGRESEFPPTEEVGESRKADGTPNQEIKKSTV